MFADISLAVRIDTAEGRLASAIAAVTEGSLITAVDSGVSVVAAPGAPCNKVIGIGLAGRPDEIALHAVEESWRRRDEPVRVELSTLADPATGELLTRRGYHLHGFENVLVRALVDADMAADVAGEIAIDRGPPLQPWLDVLVEGFAHGDGTGAVADEHAHGALDAVMRDFGRAAGFRRYLARDRGDVSGGAGLRLDEGVALLCGAATLPGHRRRGIQAVLLAARLADARREGCDLAVVTTAPGSLSQRNAEKRGFRLAYARAVLIRSWKNVAT